MGTLVRRDRLLTTLEMRHKLTLCALVAPAGFGRTVLIDQASGALGPHAAGHPLRLRAWGRQPR